MAVPISSSPVKTEDLQNIKTQAKILSLRLECVASVVKAVSLCEIDSLPQIKSDMEKLECLRKETSIFLKDVIKNVYLGAYLRSLPTFMVELRQKCDELGVNNEDFKVTDENRTEIEKLIESVEKMNQLGLQASSSVSKMPENDELIALCDKLNSAFYAEYEGVSLTRQNGALVLPRPSLRTRARQFLGIGPV